jgi:hypothetical protein
LTAFVIALGALLQLLDIGLAFLTLIEQLGAIFRAQTPHAFGLVCAASQNAAQCRRARQNAADSFYGFQSHVALHWVCRGAARRAGDMQPQRN